jgi:hypothetical protein
MWETWRLTTLLASPASDTVVTSASCFETEMLLEGRTNIDGSHYIDRAHLVPFLLCALNIQIAPAVLENVHQ